MQCLTAALYAFASFVATQLAVKNCRNRSGTGATHFAMGNASFATGSSIAQFAIGHCGNPTGNVASGSARSDASRRTTGIRSDLNVLFWGPVGL
jgi:hypothetical protein